MKYLVIYLILINLAGLWICGWDKRAAIRHRWRTPEKTLFFVSSVGGSWGFYLGMRIFRHKTKHKTFTWGIPALMLLHAVLIYFAVTRWL